MTTQVEEFGRYTLFGKIAAGGMASVYLGRVRDGEADIWYALKRVHPHLASRQDVLQMFMNEAKILSRLDHQNVCGITDYGIEKESPFLVMRYLHGAPLSGLLRKILDIKKPIPVDLMAYVVACTCEGLHYAHNATGEDGRSLGLVHRDISPQNIFVTFSGDVKLLDFGVAKAAGFQSFTRTGHIKGKYAYMSPEQVEASPLDRRSDVFSLGIVLWEMLTGRHLFKRKREIDTLRAITRAIVPAASEINHNVPQGLDAIVAKALVADKSRRYQSAEEMGRALWTHLLSASNPMGSDEVAEVMLHTFPDQPSPGDIAQSNTQPDGIAVITTADGARNRDRSNPQEPDTDPPVPWPEGLGAPHNPGEEPTVPLKSAVIAALAAMTDAAKPREPSTTDPNGVDVAPSPEEIADDADEAAPTGPALIEYRADDALQAPTLADPNLAREVREAVANLDGDDDLVRTNDYDDATVRATPLLERPAVAPHPFDAPMFDSLHSDVQDTLIKGAGEIAGMVVQTVPKAEISGNPSTQAPGGLEIEPPPPSMIETRAPGAREPERRNWTEASLSPPPARSMRWGLVGLLLLLVSAALTYWFVIDDHDEPPRETIVETSPPSNTGGRP